ncbi:MAG: hypothetical protein AB8B50_18950 [Pirellulaceae bacterium]
MSYLLQSGASNAGSRSLVKAKVVVTFGRVFFGSVGLLTQLHGCHAEASGEQFVVKQLQLIWLVLQTKDVEQRQK